MLRELSERYKLTGKSCIPSSPFSITSKVVHKSSVLKVMFLILSALSASSVDRMLGETYHKHSKEINAYLGKQQNK